MNLRKQKAAVTLPLSEQTGWKVLLFCVKSLASGLLVAFFAVLFYVTYQQFLSKEPILPLQRLILSKPLRFGDEETLSKVVHSVAEKDMLGLDMQRVVRALNKIPWVSSVEVQKHWPNALYLDINERLPVVQWGKGGYVLDKDGYRFSATKNNNQSLMIVHGPDGTEEKVLSRYRIFEPWLLGQQIPMQSLSLDERLVWHIGLPNGIDVILGKDELNNRLKKLAIVYRRVIKKYGQYVQTVDLRYQDGFSIRWKPGFKPVVVNDKNKVGA